MIGDEKFKTIESLIKRLNIEYDEKILDDKNFLLISFSIIEISLKELVNQKLNKQSNEFLEKEINNYSLYKLNKVCKDYSIYNDNLHKIINNYKDKRNDIIHNFIFKHEIMDEKFIESIQNILAEITNRLNYSHKLETFSSTTEFNNLNIK